MGSLVGLLQLIVEIMIFYYVVKFLAKLFLPMLVKKAVEKASEKYQENQNYYNTNNQDEVIINKKNTNPAATKKVGEYVDFEEID